MDKMNNEILCELRMALGKENVLLETPLSHFSYTKTGGKTDIIVFPKTEDEIVSVLKLCDRFNKKVQILGNGSNVIISDLGIDGVVVMTEKLQEIKRLTATIVYVGSGRKLSELTSYLAKQSLTGMEFACGIPGSVGGAVFMNAGAYGGEIKDVISTVIAIDSKGNVIRLEKEELEMEYRKSIFQKNNMFILGAIFKLEEGSRYEIVQTMVELNKMRAKKQPLEYPSCGSVFKRPPRNFAGKLIQEAGLQGVKIGGVQVSEKHAGFMVNVESGTAKDYQELIKYVQKKVYENSGILLEPEVKTIGIKA